MTGQLVRSIGMEMYDREGRPMIIRLPKVKRTDSRRFYGTEPSFDEHMMFVALESPEFIDLFASIQRCDKRIYERLCGKLAKSFEKTCREYSPARQELAKCAKELEKMGISLEDGTGVGTMVPYKILPIDERYSEGFAHRSKYALRYERFPKKFNGIRIDEKVLAEDGKGFQSDYNFLRARYPREAKMLDEEEKRKASPSLLSTITGALKSGFSRRYGLSQDQQEEQKIMDSLREAKRNYETYNSFTPKQKRAISKYLEALSKVLSVTAKVSEFSGRERALDQERYVETEDGKKMPYYDYVLEEGISSGEIDPVILGVFKDRVIAEYYREIKPKKTEVSEYVKLYNGQNQGIRSKAFTYLVTRTIMERHKEQIIELYKESKDLDEIESLLDRKAELEAREPSKGDTKPQKEGGTRDDD